MTKEEMSKLGIPKPLKDKMIKAAEEDMSTRWKKSCQCVANWKLMG